MNDEKLSEYIGLRLSPTERQRLDEILDRINKTSDSGVSDVLREFLGLRKRKVTTEEDALYFAGLIPALETVRSSDEQERAGPRLVEKPGGSE